MSHYQIETKYFEVNIFVLRMKKQKTKQEKYNRIE